MTHQNYRFTTETKNKKEGKINVLISRLVECCRRKTKSLWHLLRIRAKARVPGNAHGAEASQDASLGATEPALSEPQAGSGGSGDEPPADLVAPQKLSRPRSASIEWERRLEDFPRGRYPKTSSCRSMRSGARLWVRRALAAGCDPSRGSRSAVQAMLSSSHLQPSSHPSYQSHIERWLSLRLFWG